MKKILAGIFSLCVPLLAGLFLLGHAQAAAGINQQLNFQGKVVNTNGTNIPDGTYNMEFKIYQDGNLHGTGSTLKWTEDYLVGGSGGVTVTAGTFNVQLGSHNAFGSSVDWNQDTLWLSFQVGNTASCTISTTFQTNCSGDGEMDPFIRLTAVPYAMNANKLNGLSSSAFAQLGSNNAFTGTNSITTASSTAFQVINGSSKTVATIDTSSNQLTLGQAGASGLTGKLTFNNAANSNTASIQSGTTSTSYTFTLPAALPGSTQCLQSDNAGALSFTSCGASLTVSTIDSQTKSANGAVISSGALYMQTADGSAPGLVSTTTQTLAGLKTFTGGVTIKVDSASALDVQDSGGHDALVFDTTNNHLKIFEDTTTPTNYLDLYYDNATSTGFIKASSGTTQLGNGSGPISITAGSGSAVTITGHAASSFTTDSGGLTFTGAAASTWSTSAGALTITSAAGATWSTSAGDLTVQSAGALTLGSGGTSGLTLNSASGRVTVNSGDFLNTSVSGVSGAASGDIWYDSSAGKYKIDEGGTVKTLCNTTDADCGNAPNTTLTSNTTYNVPADTQVLIVAALGAGGGGSGGRTDVVGKARPGGTGGGGGAVVTGTFRGADMPSTVSVTAGTAGTGGAAGTNGNNGGNTSFGSYLTAYGGGGGVAPTSTTATAGGGGGGVGSAAATSTAGTPAAAAATKGLSGQGTAGGALGVAGNAAEWGGASGAGGPATGAGLAGGQALYGGPGGGSGGGCTTANVNSAGGAGGGGGYNTGGGANGGAAGGSVGSSGGRGSSFTAAGPYAGTAGGGGGSNCATGTGGNGGNGGIGAGGGGAGAGVTGGTGGNGGSGAVVIWAVRGVNADLAEIYGSRDTTVQVSDLLCLDPGMKAGVKKCDKQYQSNVMGVYSTAPAQVIGSVEDSDSKSVPVALSGRIPVKVSTENGVINPGDYLTSSSIPGVAMKATKAGPVIGQAMGSYDGASAGDFGIVTVFAHTGFYNGANIEEQIRGLRTDPNADISTAILGYLQKGADEAAKSAALPASEIVADRISGLEVITPSVTAKKVAADTITAGTITADTIKANQIDGLELLVDHITARSTASSTNDARAPGQPSNGNVEFDGLQVINLVALAQIEAQGGLVVDKDAQFNGKTIFALLAQFNGPAEFNDQVSFAKQPIFSSAAGGKAVIKKGVKSVHINFTTSYLQSPIVSANFVVDDTKDIHGAVAESAEDKQQRLLDAGYAFVLADVNPKGFTIILNKPANEDLGLNWSALAVNDAKLSESDTN